jgi:hypothetical protein
VFGPPAAAHPLPAAPASQPSTAAWQALAHQGLNGAVSALAIFDGDLIVGGTFTGTADGLVANLNGIARYHNGQWQALPGHGINGSVAALAVLGSDLYVGGYFTGTADGSLTNLGYIARLSADGWHPLADGGLNWDVRALAVHGSDLYVGGFFDQSAHGATQDLNAIARYSGGAWFALPNKGLFNFFILHCCFVDAFAFSANDLIASGAFTSTGDFTVQNLGGLARLTAGATWSALPNQGLGLDQPFPHGVLALDYLGSDLVAAGTFTRTTDHAVSNLFGLAQLTQSGWAPLPHNGFRLGNFGAAYALAPRGGDLYVGGAFTQTADGLVPDLNGIARLSGGAWLSLPDGGIRAGLGVGVDAITFSTDTLYVGGFFTSTAGGAVQNLGNIALLAVPPLANYPVYLPLVTR